LALSSYGGGLTENFMPVCHREAPGASAGARVTSQRLLVLVRRFLATLTFIALSIARCCRWMAVTAALVHQPVSVLATDLY
jgi:hypothetical protein